MDQTYIQGIPSVENETTISTELRSGTPWVRVISNTQLSAMRVRFAWPMLQSIDAGGNINGYRIAYKVEVATDGGAYQEVLSEAVDGKTTSTYERTRRINLPRATTGWLLRITRLTTISNAAASQQAEQGKRLALEQQLTSCDQQHSRELSDAQRNQTRLHDRLATADVRLSVLLDATDTASDCNVPATPGAAGVVHGARRAQLAPAHAQRTIGITDEGDNGLIALRACQAYVREV